MAGRERRKEGGRQSVPAVSSPLLSSQSFSCTSDGRISKSHLSLETGKWL